jgi:hypothetical protein
VRVSRFGWLLIATYLSLFLGLRYGVGTDWGNYLRSYYWPAAVQSITETVARGDPGYRILNWLAINAGLGVWAVNLTTSVIFVAGLLRFVRRLPEANLALAAAIPYVVIVVAMNYNRQAAALGVVLWSLTYLFDGKLFKYAVGIMAAGLFHKSAVIFLPAMALAGDRMRARTVVLAIATAGLGFLALLAEKADSLWDQYVVSDYSQASEGGPVRVIMNAAPAVVFLVAHNRLSMTVPQKRFWLWVSIVSLVCVPLVFIAPTAVDRVALYFTPLQFVVAAQLPLLFASSGRVIPRLAVISAYAAVLFVWLNYASNASYWLPYEFWPYWQ